MRVAATCANLVGRTVLYPSLNHKNRVGYLTWIEEVGMMEVGKLC